MDEIGAPPSFAKMANSSEPAAPEQEIEQVVSQEIEDVSPEIEDVSQSIDVETPEQAAPSIEERISFESRLRSRGYEVPDEVDPETLYDQAIERINQGTQALSELEKLRAELSLLRSQAVQPPAPAAPQAIPQTQPQQEAIAQAVEQRMFQELKRYDAVLEQFVTRDGSNRAVAKPEYGREAIEAANQINAYDRLEQEQAARLLQNPHSLMKDFQAEFEKLAEAKAQAAVQALQSSWREEQAKAQQEQSLTQQQREAEQRQQQWHEANKATIFALDTQGQPKKMPFDNSQPVLTPTGKVFMDKFWQLQERAPNTDQMVLMDLALEFAQATAPKPAVKTQTPAEQRKQFISQRTAAVPNQSTPAADLHELVAERTGKLRFAEMIRANPEISEITNNW